MTGTMTEAEREQSRAEVHTHVYASPRLSEADARAACTPLLRYMKPRPKAGTTC